MEYQEKLKDPRWQRKRLEVFQRDDFTCTVCESKDKTLHVHHKKYVYGKEPWEYELDELVTLCFECHEDEELAKKEIDGLIKELISIGYSNVLIAKLLFSLKIPVEGFPPALRVRCSKLAVQNKEILSDIQSGLDAMDEHEF